MTVKFVKDLINKAYIMQGTYSKNNYIVKVENGILTLIHYGTPILVIDLLHKKVIGIGGWSVSDVNAINTALEYFPFTEHLYATTNQTHKRRCILESPSHKMMLCRKKLDEW